MKKILILGGGYGGLKCAITLQKKLNDKNVEVTLISRHDYHYQTTLLHKVAVGTYSARKARMFYRNLLNLKNVKFTKDIIEKIDIKNKKVKGVRFEYDYDYLVIALGFRVNDFGIKGVYYHSHKLSTLNKALQIRTNIENNFKDYIFKPNPLNLSFIVCGSGFTGVEFAAELAKRVPELCKIRGLDRDLVKIYLIGRGEHILPMFDEKLSALAVEKLTKIGVKIIRGNVIECMSDGVIIEKPDKSTQKIEGNITVWTAGVKGNPVIGNSGITNTKDRVEVNEFLQIPNYPEVFVLGDCAIANSRDVKHAPTAQLASQMGEYCGESLIQILKGEKLIKPFIFKNRGTVCSIGHTDGIGVAFGYKISGEIAAFLKNVIENRWILSVANLMTVFKKGQFRWRSSD